MTAKIIHIANHSSQTLHVGLRRNEQRLEIHVYPEPDETRIEIGPNQMVSLDITPEIAACTVGDQLQYTVQGHGVSLEMTPPESAQPDGPVFRFHDPTQN